MPDLTDNAKSPLGNLRSPVQESRLKVLYSNLRDFLFERPIKVRGGVDAFSNTGFGMGVRENLSEFFKPAPKGSASAGLTKDWNAGFSGFWQNFKDFFGKQPK